MTVYVSPRLQAFYGQVWQLAVTEGRTLRWCRVLPAGSRALLIPAETPAQSEEILNAWPTLPPGRRAPYPAFLLTSESIQDAFTTIVRGARSSVAVDEQTRWSLRQAELDADVSQLTPADADVVLQVAVFGRVMI